jgi:hypothetical protein
MMLQALRRPALPDGPPPAFRPEALARRDDDATGGLGGVRLLGGPFKRAQERAGRHLLAIPTDRLLEAWPAGAGATADECCGRVGHYLSACSLMWAATREPAYRRRAEHVVGRLAARLRAAGAGAVPSFGALQPGLHDARRLAGSELALELIAKLGAGGAAAQRRSAPTDEPVERADRAEHVLVNTVLASQHGCSWPFDGGWAPESGAPAAGDDGLACLRPDAAGVRDPARIGEAIFSTEGDVLCVAQYIAAELTWRDKGLRLSQVTAFPERNAVRLIVGAGRPVALTLRLRHPAWCAAMAVHLNGQPLIASHEPGRWLDVSRSWRNGDVVDLELPMHLHLAPVFRGAAIAMLMYGPMALVAAADAAAREADAEAGGLTRPPRMPRLALRGRALADAVRRLGSTLRFSAALAGEDARLELMPCHQAAPGERGRYFELA